ncbi:MAG: AAA family ATPase [Acetobacteraceae bacterium]|nr:AAA family ATPase [Acetobacteraceae bacterium]
MEKNASRRAASGSSRAGSRKNWSRPWPHRHSGGAPACPGTALRQHPRPHGRVIADACRPRRTRTREHSGSACGAAWRSAAACSTSRQRGESGFSSRLLALRAALGDVGDAFGYIAQRVVVGPPEKDLAALITAAREMRADLVVLDTVVRTFGDGDENAARDMGGFVAALDRLRTETADPAAEWPGAHVAVIHHGRRDGANARGSIALEGAADLIVKVARGGDGEPSSATVEAAKDDVDHAALSFRLRVVELDAEGSDGEPRRTCVAEEAEGADARRAKASPSPTARQAVRCLADVVAREGEPLPQGAGFPPHANLRAVRVERWHAECEARSVSLADKPHHRRRSIARAMEQAQRAGAVASRDELAWPVRGETAP